MRTLGAAMRLAMSTSAPDFHRLDLCHARHTRKKRLARKTRQAAFCVWNHIAGIGIMQNGCPAGSSITFQLSDSCTSDNNAPYEINEFLMIL